MNVQVRFFASLREAAGTDLVHLGLPDEAGFDALMTALEQHLPAGAPDALRAENVRLARNQELVSPPFTVSDGDELAFLPPVTGG